MLKKKMIKGGIVAAIAMILLFGGKSAVEVQAATNNGSLTAGEELTLHTDANNDECLYSFTAPENGYFSVSVRKVDGKTDGYAYASFKILDENNNILTNNFTANPFETTNLVPIAKGTTYYLWLDGYHWNNELDLGVTVNFTEDPCWEKGNNSAEKALKLENGNTVYGTVTKLQRDKSIDDYYSFTIKSNSLVEITYGPKDIGGNSNFRCELVSSDNCVALSSKFNKNSTSILTQKVYLKKGTYYLVIRGGSSAEAVPYQISYKASKFTVSKPTIKSVSIKKQTYGNYRYLNSVKLSGVKLADGYQVKVSTKKTLKSALVNQTVDINNSTITKSKIASGLYQQLKDSKKTYYTGVRCYVHDAFGEKIYGSWSAVKSATN